MDVRKRRSVKDRMGLVHFPGLGEIGWRDAALRLAAQREVYTATEAEVARVARASGVSWAHLGAALNLAPQTVQRRYGADKRTGEIHG